MNTKMFKTVRISKNVIKLKLSLEFLLKADMWWQLFNVNWQSIPRVWSSNWDGLVRQAQHGSTDHKVALFGGSQPRSACCRNSRHDWPSQQCHHRSQLSHTDPCHQPVPVIMDSTITPSLKSIKPHEFGIQWHARLLVKHLVITIIQYNPVITQLFYTVHSKQTYKVLHSSGGVIKWLRKQVFTAHHIPWFACYFSP